MLFVLFVSLDTRDCLGQSGCAVLFLPFSSLLQSLNGGGMFLQQPLGCALRKHPLGDAQQLSILLLVELRFAFCVLVFLSGHGLGFIVQACHV